MPTPPNKCIAFLNLADESGLIGSQNGALLVVELQSSFVYGGYIVSPFRRTYAFNSSGLVQTTSMFLTPSDPSVTDGLVETQSLGIAPYRISVQYQDGAGEIITNLQTSNIQIPNQATVDLSTLLNVGGSSLPLPATFPVGILKGTGSSITVATSGVDYSVGTAALATGILKSTTGTGALSIAVAGDFPLLNQNTTGTAANITATSNSTLTTLSSLSLPGSQVSGNIAGNSANVTGTVALVNGGTGQTTANNALNALLPSQTGNNGKVLGTNGSTTSWTTLSGTFIAPTVQKFLSGSGTYTTPTSPAPLYIQITMAGGGGGGSAQDANVGTNGGNSTFGSSLLIATGGATPAVSTADPGVGGSATVNSPAVTLIAIVGGDGGGGQGSNSSGLSGGMGGSNSLGGAGGGGASGGSTSATSGKTNTGGGGGGSGSGLSSTAGSGGGAGAYLEAMISSPSSTYAYSVGSGGSAGVGSGTTGGAGGSGIIVVEEYYQ